MKNYKIISLIFLIIIILIISFVVTKQVKAGPGENVYGWAWSETIGWISFNNTSGGGAVSYGVNFDTGTGAFSGYAWSENIGWISFNPASVVGCATAPCDPTINIPTGVVTGWARACSVFAAGCSGALRPNSERGGWEGWIRLNDASYGITLSSVPIPSEFEGFAWGDGGPDAIIGWISFNCSNQGSCATSEYKVVTGFSINNPPTAAISCSPASCIAYYGDPLMLVNDSTDPNGDGDIVRSRWCILEASQPDYCPSYCDFASKDNCTPQSEVGVGTYTAELYVEDSIGQSDTATKPFQIRRDIAVNFECSLDDTNWYACNDTVNINPIEDDTIYFRDISVPSEGAIAITTWAWVEDDGTNPPFSFGALSTANTLAVFPSMRITLTVTDSAGRSDSKFYDIGGEITLPTWKEIPPF